MTRTTSTAEAVPSTHGATPGSAPGSLDVVVLCTRDPGARVTGRISVLRSHLRALEALGHRVRVVVVAAAPPGSNAWTRRFPTAHVRAPGLASAAVSVAMTVAVPPGLRRGTAGLAGSRRPTTLNEALFVDPRVRRDVAAAAAGADLVVADGLRLSSAAALLGDVPVVVDLDDLLSDRYRRMRRTLSARQRDTPAGASTLGIVADRLPAPLRPAAESLARALLGVEVRRTRAREVAVTASAAAVTLVSPEETATLAGRTGRPVSWLPPTVDVPYAPLPVGEGLVFLGGLDYRPNVEAVRFWRDAVVPALREASPGAAVPPLHLVGHCPDAVRTELEGPDVVVDGFVDDLGQALTRRAMVAPLLDPGGVKLKVLDALAQGLPVVGTPQAFDGTGLDADLRWGGADPVALAAAVRSVLDDDGLRDRLARDGRAHVAATFGHEAGARRWAALLGQVLPPGARTGEHPSAGRPRG